MRHCQQVFLRGVRKYLNFLKGFLNNQFLERLVENQFPRGSKIKKLLNGEGGRV